MLSAFFDFVPSGFQAMELFGSFKDGQELLVQSGQPYIFLLSHFMQLCTAPRDLNKSSST